MVNMLIAAWNIRGLNTSLKNKEVKKLLNKHGVQLFGIIETRVRPNNLDCILHYYRHEWQIETSGAQALNTRIMLLWKDDILEVEVLSKSAQFIHTYVRSRDGSFTGYVTFVYAFN